MATAAELFTEFMDITRRTKTILQQAAFRMANLQQAADAVASESDESSQLTDSSEGEIAKNRCGTQRLEEEHEGSRDQQQHSTNSSRGESEDAEHIDGSVRELQLLVNKLGISLEGQYLDDKGEVEKVDIGELPTAVCAEIVKAFATFQTCSAAMGKADGLALALPSSTICLRQASLARAKGASHPIDSANCACQTCSTSKAPCLRALTPKHVAVFAPAREFRSDAVPADKEFWIGELTENLLWRTEPY